jgi:hypothetical protein
MTFDWRSAKRRKEERADRPPLPDIDAMLDEIFVAPPAAADEDVVEETSDTRDGIERVVEREPVAGQKPANKPSRKVASGRRPAPLLNRMVFKTDRLGEFVGRRELTAQIGHSPDEWPLVILKEAADNALDGCEEGLTAPELRIDVETDEGWIKVTDNGPGIAPQTVRDILDYTSRVSSREA